MARTVWILCAPSLEDVIITIRSRSRHVRLRTPPAGGGGRPAAAPRRHRRARWPCMPRGRPRATSASPGGWLATRAPGSGGATSSRSPGRSAGSGTPIDAAADLAKIAEDESGAASAERDAAERQRLMETLGADPSARTQPPHIRSQIAGPGEGAEGPGHPVLARRPRPFAARPALDLPRRAGPAHRRRRRAGQPGQPGRRPAAGPGDDRLSSCSTPSTPSARRASGSASTSTRCSRSRPWRCPCACLTDRTEPPPGPRTDPHRPPHRPASPRPEGRVGGHACGQPGYRRCMRLTGRPLAAAALALALGLSGCTLIGGGRERRAAAGPSTPKTPQTPPSRL